MTKDQRRKQVLTALDLVNLRDRMNHRPAMLSGGQQQRVGIARAMVTDPALIVADEPTGDLDTKSADEVLNIMQILCTQLNKTIIMVTHDPHAAERATRVLAPGEGRVGAGRHADGGPGQAATGGSVRPLTPSSEGGPRLCEAHHCGPVGLASLGPPYEDGQTDVQST